MTHTLEALPGQMRTAERLENVPRGTENQLRQRRPLLTSLTPIFLRNAVGNSAPIIAKMMSLAISIGPSSVAREFPDSAPGFFTGSSTTMPGLISLSAVAG